MLAKAKNMKRPAVIILGLVALIIGNTSPIAHAEQIVLPPLELPEQLRPYANISEVLTAATEVISLLKTAKVLTRPSSARPPNCNRKEILSVYRGMAATQATYKLFVNRVELGWLSTESMMNDAVGRNSGRAFLKPYRLALWAIWNPTQVTKLVAIVDHLSSLPSPIKYDLAQFLHFLQSGQDMYNRIRKRSPEKLAEIERISKPIYSALRREARSLLPYDADKKKLDEFARQWPEHLFYDDESKEYRHLVDNVRNIGQGKLDSCLDGDMRSYNDKGKKTVRLFISRIEFGEKGEIADNLYGHYPIAYAIGFWQRRHNEATTKLADFLLRKAISKLESNN